MSFDLRHHSMARRARVLPALRSLLLSTVTVTAAACGGTTATGGTQQQGATTAQAAGMQGVATAQAGAVAASMTSTSNAAGSTAAAPSGSTAAAGAGAAAMAGMPRADPTGAVVVGMGPPTFTRVWEEILMPKGCAGAYCHGSGQGTLKFMKKEDAYTALVGVAATGPKCGSSGKMRVKPSDPDASLILDKMSHEMPSCGDAMPIGTKLEPNCVSMNTSVCNTMADLKLMRDWITAGAMNN